MTEPARDGGSVSASIRHGCGSNCFPPVFSRVADTAICRYRVAMDEPVTPATLREQAAKCRRLSREIDDPRTSDALLAMADDYEARAVMLDNSMPLPRQT